MERNKDEALVAKKIAEKKFAEKDFISAKKFALMAQNLFPALDGLKQLIATLDVYILSQHKVNGENDWYAILRVNFTADEDIVKKQYRKLALLLHPDKNKSVGAEGAFKLISEAWSVLSDKSRRTLYDEKRSAKSFMEIVFQTNKKRTASSTANGFPKFFNGTVNAHTAKGSTKVAPATVNPSHKPSTVETFWTSCSKCKMQYEYLKLYLNHTLLCPNCHEPFLATETKSPCEFVSSVPISQQSQPNSNHNVSSKNVYGQGKSNPTQNRANPGSFRHPNFQWGPFSRTAGVASAAASSTAAAHAANVVHQTYEKVRREREEAQAAARKKEARRRKNNALKRDSSASGILKACQSNSIPAEKGVSIGDDPGNDHTEFLTQQIPAKTNRDLLKFKMAGKQSNQSREFYLFSTKNMLIELSKSAIDEKLKEWKPAASMKLEVKDDAKKRQKLSEASKKESKDVVHQNVTGQEQPVEQPVKPKSEIKQLINEKLSDADSDNETNEPVSMDVPDPDFHDFDNDRTEQSFQADEIWATYDDEDGMPRYYALVQKVIKLNPFKICISFLTSKSNSEFAPLNWVASGFPKSCGDFRVGHYEVNDTINIFSHKVRWEKGPRGVIKIIPRKGEFWALYRNWSPEWNEHTPDDIIYKYDMVEVLEDYNEEHGVSVIPLVKVSGFRTVFGRSMNSKEVKRIQKEDMFQFSHQVPSYLLSGEESDNSPKGFFELDPAATPLELLQKINTEVEVGATEPIVTKMS